MVNPANAGRHVGLAVSVRYLVVRDAKEVKTLENVGRDSLGHRAGKQDSAVWYKFLSGLDGGRPGFDKRGACGEVSGQASDVRE